MRRREGEGAVAVRGASWGGDVGAAAVRAWADRAASGPLPPSPDPLEPRDGAGLGTEVTLGIDPRAALNRHAPWEARSIVVGEPCLAVARRLPLESRDGSGVAAHELLYGASLRHEFPRWGVYGGYKASPAWRPSLAVSSTASLGSDPALRLWAWDRRVGRGGLAAGGGFKLSARPGVFVQARQRVAAHTSLTLLWRLGRAGHLSATLDTAAGRHTRVSATVSTGLFTEEVQVRAARALPHGTGVYALATVSRAGGATDTSAEAGAAVRFGGGHSVEAGVRSSFAGAALALRYRGGRFSLTVPVMLTEPGAPWSHVAAVALVPAALLAAALWSRRRGKRRRAAAAAAAEADAAAEEGNSAALREAESQRGVMAARAAEVLAAERARPDGGLEILSAWFGESAARAVDVRVPLQFFVRGGALRLPASAKSGMLGFCNPTACDPSRLVLHVEYRLRGVRASAVCGEAEALVIE